MILELTNIKKSYKKHLVLDGINLTIDKPRLIALIAPNGSGKTTLLNIICNLQKADFGTVTIDGITNQTQVIFNEVTYMQDNSVLYTELTGLDHIKLIQSMHSLTNERVDEVLTNLKMKDYMNKKVHEYSLGMKQHLLFALAILPKPKLLLMDEPLNGLDPASVVRVRENLKELHKAGTTVLFSSHNLDQIDKLTDDIYFLKNKQLVSYQEIVAKMPHTYTIVASNIESPLQPITKHKGTITCSKEEIDCILSDLGNEILDCEEKPIPLEQLYFELFEDYRDDSNYI